MRYNIFNVIAASIVALAILFPGIVFADSTYLLDDGTPEQGIAYLGTNGTLWINGFQL